MLGTAILSFSPGQAHAEQKHPKDNGVRCWTRDAGTGEWEAHLPGDQVVDMVVKKIGTCGNDGQWHWAAMTAQPSNNHWSAQSAGSAMYAP
jgi:hypothetical protein